MGLGVARRRWCCGVRKHSQLRDTRCGTPSDPCRAHADPESQDLRPAGEPAGRPCGRAPGAEHASIKPGFRGVNAAPNARSKLRRRCRTVARERQCSGPFFLKLNTKVSHMTHPPVFMGALVTRRSISPIDRWLQLQTDAASSLKCAPTFSLTDAFDRAPARPGCAAD